MHKMKPYGEIKPTISQVAALAEVSMTTVSLYLHGNRRVCSAATAARIDLAVQKLNYEPNPLAGANFAKQRRTLGLVAGDDLERGNRPWNVYNIRIINGILEVANEHDYSVLTYPHRVFLERRYRAVLDGRVDGLLFYGSPDNDFVERVSQAGMPVVCFGAEGNATNTVGSAYADECLISDTALEHLWSLGHRKIAHLAGPFADCVRLFADSNNHFEPNLERGEPVSRARMEGAVKFLREHHVLNENWISPPHAWRNADVVGTLEKWFSGHDAPTAIYCANDFIALEVFFWAAEKGLRIPHDIAVIGVDNIQATSSDPFLSSIEFDVEAIGRQAVHAFLDYLAGRAPADNVRIVRDMKLIQRPSTVGRSNPPLELHIIRETMRKSS